MTRRRFYATPDSFNADKSSATLNADETRHLRDVLRLTIGDEVYVFDGEGREFRCAIAEVDRTSARLRIIEEVTAASPESALNLTLAGGTVTLGPSFQGGTITNLNSPGSALSGNYTVTGTLNLGNGLSGSLHELPGATVSWTGGNISGSGVVVDGGATMH